MQLFSPLALFLCLVALISHHVEASDCAYTVVDQEVDCGGFALDHGKLTLEGNQLVDKEGGE